MYTIHVYTDGACSGNPGPGGAAAIVVINGKSARFSRGFKKTTNNRMEIMGVILGLEGIAVRRPGSGTTVIVHTDSQLVYGTMAQGWKKKANADLWARLDRVIGELATKGVTVGVDKVKGHAGNEWNELADRLAVAARLADNLLDDTGYNTPETEMPFGARLSPATVANPEIPFDEYEEEYEDDAAGADEKPLIPYRVTTEGGRSIVIDPFTFNDKRYGLVADAYGRTIGIIDM